MTNEAVPVTVTELTDRIKSVIELDPALRKVLVRGELSNYKIYPSGHHYFTLKDAGASLRCVMFKSDAQRVRFHPENGMNVLCTGRVAVYPRDGAYQLYVTGLTSDGVGDLYLAFEQLKAKLGEEGLFDREHKKPIPAMPERIAVITSGAGAAVRDVIRVLGKRWPMSKVIILPVRVQGSGAAAEIAGAIRYANRYRVADVIITGRGGGSMEDLWAFNEEILARAIFASEIPVISAVGHEPDVTITDFVADMRAATPSNGAELAVPEWEAVNDALLKSRVRMNQAMHRALDNAAGRLTALAERPIMESPMAFVQQRRLDVDRLAERLDAAEREIIADNKQQYVRLSSALEAMSPLKVLSRGYSVVTGGDGGLIRSSEDAREGELVHVRLRQGGLDCRVEKQTEE